MTVPGLIGGIADNLPRGATGWITLALIGVGLVVLFLIVRRFVRSQAIQALVLAVPAVGLLWWMALPLVVDRRVDEAFPLTATTEPARDAPTASVERAEPERISSGTFRGIGHRAAGRVSLYKGAEGNYLVRLEEIDLQNGPDLFVYLVPRANQEQDDGAVNLGRLKGNQGNQNYEVPAGADPTQFRTVLIWCRQFAVPFANATLA